MNENTDSWIHEHLKEIEKETIKKIPEETRITWLLHAESCQDVFSSIHDSEQIKEYDESYHSMLVLRLFELNKTMLWLQICANYGTYRPLLRELRFFLESFAQAYHLDKLMPHKIMLEKYHYLNENERTLYGGQLFNQLDFNEKEELRKFYHLLSDYTHSSSEELKNTAEYGEVSDRFINSFDEELFKKCLQLTTITVDWCFFITLKKFSDAIPFLKNQPNLEYWFDKLQYERTKQLMIGKNHET